MLMKTATGFIRIYPLAPGGYRLFMDMPQLASFSCSTGQPSSKADTTLETIPCTMVMLRGQMSNLHSNGIDNSDVWSQK